MRKSARKLRAKRRQTQRQHRERRAAERALGHAPSRLAARAASPWREPQAADARATLEACDGFAHLRNALHAVASERDYWCGIPMPISDARLVIEPGYPNAAGLMAIGLRETGADAEHAAAKIRNSFWSWRWRCDVLVWEEDGRIQWGQAGHPHHITMDMRSLGCCDAWGIEQEAKAVHTLAGLLRHRQFKQYMLTGMFMERSQRSGVSYLFRRLKPTVAISTRTERVRVLAALCLHPIAYYAGSWAGAMTPTDDVIAHLMMMRGDERMFWRRANQHAPFRPEAGL